MFDSPLKLLLGLLTGLVFGFLLQKGRVSKHSVIVGQLLLRDWTVVKIMATAVAVGAIGVYALVALGVAHVAVKPAQLGGLVVGAASFGVGLAVLGYCPGTGVAAAGEGKRDALVGVLGMFVGALSFVALHAPIERLRGAAGDFGEITWPMATSTSPWPWIGGIAAAVAVAYLIRRGQRVRERHSMSH